MLYPARWKKITVDQSKVLKNWLYRTIDCSVFWGATRCIEITSLLELLCLCILLSSKAGISSAPNGAEGRTQVRAHSTQPPPRINRSSVTLLKTSNTGSASSINVNRNVRRNATNATSDRGLSKAFQRLSVNDKRGGKRWVPFPFFPDKKFSNASMITLMVTLLHGNKASQPIYIKDSMEVTINGKFYTMGPRSN